jgi:vanillate O-demethylase monooxygenase subunit
MDYEYNIPGIMLSRTGTFAVGTGASCDYKRPDLSLASYLSCSSQAVTPTGPKTAPYFFSYGVHRNYGAGPTTEQMMAVIARAFEEDRVMIEAQQRVIDLTPNPAIMPTVHDRGRRDSDHGSLAERTTCRVI